MRFSFLNGVLAPVAILASFALAALVVRLLWRRLLVRGREIGRPGRWMAETTTTPVFLLLLAVGAQITVTRLARLPELRGGGATPYLTGATYVFTVLCATWVVYGLVKGFSDWHQARAAPRPERTIDADLMPAFRRIAQVVLVFAALTVILDHYDVKLTALLGAAGVASLAIALAAQDTIANMISGFTIMADRPFRLGDRVELPSGRIGDVQEIGLRSTKILSIDNTMHIIPNSEIAKSSVVNWSYPNNRVNLRNRIGVAYGCDPARVKQVLLEIARAHPAVLRAPEPIAFFAEFADSSLQFQFNFWIDDFRLRGAILDEINTEIYRRFTEEGIPIPFPQMDVWLRNGEGATGRPERHTSLADYGG